MTNELTLELDRGLEVLSIYVGDVYVGSFSHVTGVERHEKEPYSYSKRYNVMYHRTLIGVLWNVVEVRELW